MGPLNGLLKTRLAKRWLYSGRTCKALKTDETKCDKRALKKSRYCVEHQSSIPLLVAIILPIAGWVGGQVWAHFHPSEELQQLRALAASNKASLSVTSAYVDIGVKGVPIVSCRWQNFGVFSAQDVRLNIVVTDGAMSKVISRFHDSIHEIGRGSNEAAWGDVHDVKPSLPWPEMVILASIEYRSPGIKGTETNLWLGVLKETPAQSLSTIPAGFAPVSAYERQHYLSNISKLVGPKPR